MSRYVLRVGMAATLVCGMSQAAVAATRCVKPGGGSGCFAKIGDAVAASGPGDTILVGHGTYEESVVIDRAVSLIGVDPDDVIIDATGLSWGINVDGLDHPGAVDHVVVRNFTVKNANNEGILVSNASDVTIADNRVLNNNQGLDVSTITCPTVEPPDTH